MSRKESPWSCYCLLSESGSTYIGSTIDIERRLRQHKGELSGGARATSRGKGWTRVCHVVGFPDESAALQFEWRWKQLSRKESSSKPIERRIAALCTLLTMDKATSKAKPFCEFDGPLQIHLEQERFAYLFESKELSYGVLV